MVVRKKNIAGCPGRSQRNFCELLFIASHKKHFRRFLGQPQKTLAGFFGQSRNNFREHVHHQSQNHCRVCFVSSSIADKNHGCFWSFAEKLLRIFIFGRKQTFAVFVHRQSQNNFRRFLWSVADKLSQIFLGLSLETLNACSSWLTPLQICSFLHRRGI